MAQPPQHRYTNAQSGAKPQSSSPKVEGTAPTPPRRNLEQIRAAGALEFWAENQAQRGQEGGEVIAKLPALLINNGLLATAAFCKAKGGGHEALMLNILQFLKAPEIGILTIAGFRQGEDEFSALVRAAAVDSLTLQRATAEALAYVNYLKRFQPPKPSKKEEQE